MFPQAQSPQAYETHPNGGSLISWASASFRSDCLLYSSSSLVTTHFPHSTLCLNDKDSSEKPNSVKWLARDIVD